MPVPRGITAPPEHHHGNAKRKSARGPTDRHGFTGLGLCIPQHPCRDGFTPPLAPQLCWGCVSALRLPCRPDLPAFPIARLGCGWSRLSLCPRLSTASLSPCRLSVHGRRRLWHWERGSFVVGTRAEPQQPQLSTTTASTALLHSENQRTFARPEHSSSEGKPKLNVVCSLLSLKTGWNGRWRMNPPPWTILSPFPPPFPCST